MSNGIGLDEQGSVKIQGDSDDTLIGNIEDRLKVTTRAAGLPDESVIPFVTKAQNAGSTDMAIDGSTTPAVFTAGPTTTDDIWYVSRIGFTMNDIGTAKLDSFGAISDGLTNGLLVQIDINGTTYTTSNVKTNAELIVGFETTFRGQSNSFINDLNFITATTFFVTPVRLLESQSDQFKLTVRDDLTGLELLEVFLFYTMVAP